ncbi:4-hydroxyproline epimerase [Chelatococcus asaccharovorans]|uniref:4-hydroxyproline epimerase n=1 Tax=Chelatococcus asaccharovorans TaxID=28210 RepID=A0A2V3UI79_9HYPH|nr:4-hydroxyproline epimerase [Chelatococcus asaccharovorans]MBS7706286.1 4-hydroxyproline epimerase [Chelatococcus asaccharovorans]PXW65075.1 proline racemase [Chelatococcus asaccharovorans]
MTRHIFECIDGHTCGNPIRIVKTGAPPLRGETMAEKREHFIRDYDWIRRALMFEPRGHDIMSGLFFYPSRRPEVDIGIVFIEVDGCLPMCGHGTIGAATLGVEEGLIKPKREGQIVIEVPAGIVEASYERNGDFVESVRLTNVASYLHAVDVKIDVPGLGQLIVDVAFGGNFFAIIEPQRNWQGFENFTGGAIVRWSPLIRELVQEAVQPTHPLIANAQGISHVMWCDGPKDPRAHGRSAAFYGEKAIDRSPCGTGSSARIAHLFGKGRLSVGDTYINESLIGTLYDCRIEKAADIAGRPGIIPSIAGWARLTGYNTLIVDDRDPLKHGFQLI